MADEAGRRSVVPTPVREAAHGSPWLPAAWTGVGAAVVCATTAIVAVAACWLPVSGTTGRTNSAIRAGLLTFLASVHGGVTVDGVQATWLPLGMLAVVGVTAWRAGSGLADAVDRLGVSDPARLALAGAAQAASFAACALLAVPFAALGSSRAPFVGVALGALLVFGLTGTVSYVRACPLREVVAQRLPGWLSRVVRAVAGATAVYLLFGAVVTAGSLVAHHGAAERLAASFGSGVAGVPVLLLSVLAAPNAAVAGSSYLAGPGFALGTGTHVSLFVGTHGTLPAFPLLAAVPTGTPNPAVWTLAGLTPLLAGVVVARGCLRAGTWAARLVQAVASAAGAGAVMSVLAWQAGGAVGDGRLHTVGASPWQLGGAVAVALATMSLVALGLTAAWRAVRGEDEEDDEYSFYAALRPRLASVPAVDVAGQSRQHDDDDVDEADDLAG